MILQFVELRDVSCLNGGKCLRRTHAHADVFKSDFALDVRCPSDTEITAFYAQRNGSWAFLMVYMCAAEVEKQCAEIIMMFLALKGLKLFLRSPIMNLLAAFKHLIYGLKNTVMSL